MNIDKKLLSLVTIIVFTVSPIFITNFYAYGAQAIWRDYHEMKELVNDIRNGDKDDDNVGLG